MIAAFAGAVAIGLLAIGPFVMTALLGDKGFHYGRLGLALVGLGMGLHLTAGTLNQAALARGRAPLAAVAWLASAALFVAFMLSEAISNEVTRVEVSYFTAALVLCGLLWAVYRPHAGAQRLGRGLERRRGVGRQRVRLRHRDAHRVPQLGERIDDRPRDRLALGDIGGAGRLNLVQGMGRVLLDRGQEALEGLLGLLGVGRGRVVERAAPGNHVLLKRRDRRAHGVHVVARADLRGSTRSAPRARREREQHDKS